jgi:anti-anti-sigma factor
LYIECGMAQAQDVSNTPQASAAPPIPTVCIVTLDEEFLEVLRSELVPWSDSSGIGSLVNALRQVNKAGGTVKLVPPPPFVAKTLKMVGILTPFGVYDSEADAVSSCTWSVFHNLRRIGARLRVPSEALDAAEELVRARVLCQGTNRGTHEVGRVPQMPQYTTGLHRLREDSSSVAV